MTAKWRLYTARALLIVCIILVFVPFLYQFGMSLKPTQDIFRQPLAPLSFPATLEHYQRVLTTLPMLEYFWNSVVFTLSVTMGQLLIGIPAAFAFSYYEFPFKRFLFALILVSLMVPFVVTYLPNYLLLASLGLLNTLPGMIIPMIANAYGIFLLRQHFKSFPKSILEAALIDGASHAQMLWRVLVPANISAITAIAIYVIINTWNQYVWPLLVGGRGGLHTLTVAVPQFASSEGGSDWGAMMAAATLATLPTLFLYLLLRKRVLETFTEGTVR